MGQRSKGVGLHHRCYLRRLDGFAAAILLRPCGLVEIGLEEMTDQEDRFAGLDLDNPSPGNRANPSTLPHTAAGGVYDRFRSQPVA
jgi:hypothetical protein